MPVDIEAMANSIQVAAPHEVVIEGFGEPLIDIDKVQMLLTFIRPYVPKVTMFTSLPPNLNTPAGYDQLVNLITTMDGVNISLRHANYEIAARISQEQPPLSDWRNRYIRHFVKDGLADKFRVSLELCGNVYNTPDAVNNCVCDLYYMGVKHVKLTEIMKNDVNWIRLEDVVPVELGDPIWSGCSTYVKSVPDWITVNHFLEQEGCSLLLRRGCFMVTAHRRPTIQARLKLALRRRRPNYWVVWPDGLLTNSYERFTGV
jgi:hypothetical protein